MEIEKLKELLKRANIPFNEKKIYGGTQIVYPSWSNTLIDIVYTSLAPGYKDNLLEVENLKEDCIKYLSAEETFDLIKKTTKGETK